MEVGSVWKLGLKLLLRDNGPLVGAIEKLALGFMRERHHRGGRLDMSLRSVGIAIGSERPHTAEEELEIETGSLEPT